MSFKNVCTVLGVILLGYSCQPEVMEVNPSPDAIPAKAFSNVDSRLWRFFEKFEEEASHRGLEIDLNQAKITGKIQNLEQAGVLAQCINHANQANEVVIDAHFWEIASEISREMIVFHELGHCYLLRPHVDKVTEDGACASIMRSGIGSCIDNYRYATRDIYLDELFSVHFRHREGQSG